MVEGGSTSSGLPCSCSHAKAERSMSIRICSSGTARSDWPCFLSLYRFSSLSMALFNHVFHEGYENTVAIILPESYRRKGVKRRAADIPLKDTSSAARYLEWAPTLEDADSPRIIKDRLFRMHSKQ